MEQKIYNPSGQFKAVTIIIEVQVFTDTNKENHPDTVKNYIINYNISLHETYDNV